MPNKNMFLSLTFLDIFFPFKRAVSHARAACRKAFRFTLCQSLWKSFRRFSSYILTDVRKGNQILRAAQQGCKLS
jgi:hypothetical protein